MTDNPVAFLSQIWEDQPEPERSYWRFLAYFDEGHTFTEVPLRSDAQIEIPNDGVDVYFCPNLFTRNKRRNPHALPGRWLYADLDESDPHGLRIPPTLAWETSPGRYQAAWRLSKSVKPETLAVLNQRMTYLSEADRGGWSLTKVLRVPGTESHKRDRPVDVKLLWNDGETYKPKELWTILKHVQTPGVHGTATAPPEKLPSKSHVIRKHRSNLDARAKKILRTKTVLGTEDRSQTLWHLYNLLLDDGLAPEEVLVLAQHCAYNKWAGQRGELNKLWSEIQKAVSVREQATTKARAKRKRARKREDASDNGVVGKLGWTTSEVAQTEPVLPPDWMISGIWSEQAHGLLAGDSKSYKSTIALDLACSVATGTKFLDEFDVQRQGPVLFIQEENDANHLHWIHNQILASRGMAMGGSVENGRLSLNLESPPIFFLHNTGFLLTEEEHLDQLAADIELLKPKLVVLDPFYRMAPGVDENSAKDVGAVLGPLLDLKQDTGVGLLLIHHWNKPSSQNPQTPKHRISGSGVFGRWFESSIYVEPTAIAGTVHLLTEHRKAPPSEGFHVNFDIDQPGAPGYNVKVMSPKEEAADQFQEVRDLLIEAGHAGLFVPDLAARLGVNEKTLRHRLQGMDDIEWVTRQRGTAGRPKKAVKLR